MIRCLWWPLLTLLLLPFPSVLAADGEQVDVELVLAVDISYSMDADELALQREGYIAALASEQFLDAVRRGPIGKIAVVYVEWAGSAEQQVIIPWQVIDGPASADEFAHKLRQVPIRRAYRTSIANALKFSAEQFGTNYKGLRRVIDVSGDGTNNQGDLIVPTRDEIVRKGITINGLPILTNTTAGAYPTPPDLDLFFRDCVIGGPGAFYIVAHGFEDFARAVRKKLIIEIAGAPPERLWHAAAEDKRQGPTCDIGERHWKRIIRGGIER